MKKSRRSGKVTASLLTKCCIFHFAGGIGARKLLSATSRRLLFSWFPLWNFGTRKAFPESSIFFTSPRLNCAEVALRTNAETLKCATIKVYQYPWNRCRDFVSFPRNKNVLHYYQTLGHVVISISVFHVGGKSLWRKKLLRSFSLPFLARHKRYSRGK